MRALFNGDALLALAFTETPVAPGWLKPISL